MRTAEKNRLAARMRVLHKSIATVIKTLDKEIAKLDHDIDAHLKRHFNEQARRFEDIKGIGPGTCATRAGLHARAWARLTMRAWPSLPAWRR